MKTQAQLNLDKITALHALTVYPILGESDENRQIRTRQEALFQVVEIRLDMWMEVTGGNYQVYREMVEEARRQLGLPPSA